MIDIKKNKKDIKRIAYSGVVADLFHYGHLHSLEFAKSISDYNICGVLTDEAVEKYRTKPIANFEERKAVVANLRCVDRLMIQHSRDPTENLKEIHKEFPNAEIILVHGSDLKYVHGSEYIKKINGSVIQHPYYKRLSTFKIIDKIVENKDNFKDIRDFSSYIAGEEDLTDEGWNKTIISTKANTLKALTPLLKKSNIENMYVFTVPDWKNNKRIILKEITEKFSPGKIVIRSSAVNEDTFDNSMAGCFKSVINVNAGNIKELETGIKKVIDSYKNKTSESSFNQVLVQTQTKDIVMSGVIFTRTLETNAPYYVINYDDSTGETDTVTKGIENRTIKISKFVNLSKIPTKLKKLITAIKEIESLIPKMSLDIEFAINKKGEIIIFQVRPITIRINQEHDDEIIKEKINSLKNQFNDLAKRKSHLSGKKTIFADMPDWNPAEIIGDNPNLLDYSLYDYIITDSIWHKARTSQGYYDVNPAKLVRLFGNKPYIDVRNTFNSFTPVSISKNLREKLINFYLDKLEKNPELQDKVEFEVLYTCYDLCFDNRSKELLKENFSKNEIFQLKKSLIELTNNLIIDSKKSISKDLSFIKEMEKNRSDIMKKTNKSNISVRTLLDDAKFLLDDCRKKGTLQFSRLARLGFIGKIILKSLVKKKIIDKNFYDNFMNSIRTVATQINEDFILLSVNKISKKDFLKKYYHLRPGSYDITSLRYESNPELLKTNGSKMIQDERKTFKMNFETEKNITKALLKNNLRFNAKELLEFVKSSLEARELSKFEFTKNLSDAIELIALAGEKMGFTRQELALLNLSEVLLAGVEDRDKITKKWKNQISLKIKERELNNKIILPPIIYSEKDFDIVQPYIPRPNYITQKKIKGRLIKIGKVEKKDIPEIEGNIALIENADPGYDWVFTRKPAGLITKYGGVASHMSIRCAEFGIPAAIGCGVLFNELNYKDSVILDCKLGKIIPVGEK